MNSNEIQTYVKMLCEISPTQKNDLRHQIKKEKKSSDDKLML